jgi:hypothetical protein
MSTAPARVTSERLLTPADNETLLQHITRSTKNFFISCFGCIQTSDEKAKIRYYQYLIESRKKAFGVEYVNLLKASASQADLGACVQKCLKDIDRIYEDIATLNAEVEKVTGETKKRIIQAPSKTPAATSTTSAAATALPVTVTSPENPAVSAESSSPAHGTESPTPVADSGVATPSAAPTQTETTN